MIRMRLFVLCLMLVFTVVIHAQDDVAETATPAPSPPVRPAPVATLNNDGLVLERYFASLTQGQVGLLHLTGENIQDARILFRSREYRFMPLEGDGMYAFILSDIDAQPRDYPLSVLIQKTDGVIATFDITVTVETGGFVRQNFDVPSNLAYLIDPLIERNEYARLDAIIKEQTPEPYWDEFGFVLPMDSNYTSSFGQYRILNQTVQTRHTGWDQSAPVGTPVTAMADGVVAFAGQLDIRGNYVMINHGWGVYSGYAHFSQLLVERGQTIERGQIIGMSGNSGRSSGPHLHWEVAVNGEWVDGAQFIGMWLP